MKSHHTVRSNLISANGWMDGWMHGLMDGWMAGWMDGLNEQNDRSII